MVSHGLVTMWLLTKIPNPIWYPGTGTQIQYCVAIVIPTVFHPRLDILDPYPYPYPWYPYPWSRTRTRTHTHIYGLVPIPVPIPMTLSGFVPVPVPVSMVSYPYPYPYPWSRTCTRTHTHGLVPIPVPVPMIRTHTTSLFDRCLKCVCSVVIGWSCVPSVTFWITCGSVRLKYLKQSFQESSILNFKLWYNSVRFRSRLVNKPTAHFEKLSNCHVCNTFGLRGNCTPNQVRASTLALFFLFFFLVKWYKANCLRNSENVINCNSRTLGVCLKFAFLGHFGPYLR